MQGFPGLNQIRSSTKRIQIPLPALEVQKEIVAEIEGYQKVIDGASAVVDNYRPRIAVDPGWPMVSTCASSRDFIERTGFQTQKTEAESDSGGLPIVRIQNLTYSRQYGSITTLGK